MNWAESLSVFFAFLGLGILFHGFPDIKIGGKHEYHYHNNED